MVGTTEFLPKPPTLRAKDLNIGDTAKIESTEIYTSDAGQRRLVAYVEYKKESRTIYFNKTSVLNLAADISKETDDWIGEKIVVKEINPTRLGDSVIWGVEKVKKGK